jgi:hypothetical protein
MSVDWGGNGGDGGGDERRQIGDELKGGLAARRESVYQGNDRSVIIAPGIGRYRAGRGQASAPLGNLLRCSALQYAARNLHCSGLALLEGFSWLFPYLSDPGRHGNRHLVKVSSVQNLRSAIFYICLTLMI